MSILSNEALTEKISAANCGNCEDINNGTLEQMASGEAIFIVPIKVGGSGINNDDETDVIDTLKQISASDAATVNGNIITKYEIVSQNGFPN